MTKSSDRIVSTVLLLEQSKRLPRFIISQIPIAALALTKISKSAKIRDQYNQVPSPDPGYF